MSFTEAKLMELGEAHHRGLAVYCPTCKALLEPLESNALTQEPQGVDVFFACQRCGTGEWYRAGRNPTPWTTAQQTQIVEDYWRRRAGVCPNDRGHLRFIASNSIGGPNFVIVHCPICGAVADSSKTGPERVNL